MKFYCALMSRFGALAGHFTYERQHGQANRQTVEQLAFNGWVVSV